MQFEETTRRNNLSFTKSGVYNTFPPFFRTVQRVKIIHQRKIEREKTKSCNLTLAANPKLGNSRLKRIYALTKAASNFSM
jgi:hypothetical protein